VRRVHGELVVVDDVPGEFAERVIEAFHSRPHDGFSFAVSGGSLARDCYERLADDAGSQIDWWKVDVYWGDERCVPLDDESSNYRLVRESLLEKVGAVNANYPMRCDEGPDPYQLRLGELGRIDVVHLGMGPDGHTASLFPDSVALDADPGRLVVMNDDPSGTNPFPRMTFTYAGIARARLALVTVTGDEKRDALARVADDDPGTPAAHIRADRVLWIADPAAAGDLA
jgi:6-phosphogluconolactonase